MLLGQECRFVTLLPNGDVKEDGKFQDVLQWMTGGIMGEKEFWVLPIEVKPWQNVEWVLGNLTNDKEERKTLI